MKYFLKNARGPAAALVLCVGLSLPQVSGAQDEPTPAPTVEVSADGDRYTVRAEDATLEDVLGKLEEVTGVEVDVAETLLSQRVSVELIDVTFEKVMTELAGSHALIYERDAEGNLRLSSARVTSQEQLDERALSRADRRDIRRKQKEIARVSKEIGKLYGYVGVVDYEQGKTIAKERKERFQELVDRLADLGPGGARAMLDSYPDMDETRSKLAMLKALGKINDPEASLTLGSLYEAGDNFSMLREMVGALGHRSDPQTQAVLTGILTGESDIRLRAAVVQALSGQSGAVGTLSGVMDSKSEKRDVRREAVRSVGLIGGDEARVALAELARTSADPTVRKTAIQELGRSFGEGSLPSLEVLLSDPDDSIRHNVVKAIARVQSSRSRELLSQIAASDPSEAVRQSAQRYLGGQE